MSFLCQIWIVHKTLAVLGFKIGDFKGGGRRIKRDFRSLKKSGKVHQLFSLISQQLIESGVK